MDFANAVSEEASSSVFNEKQKFVKKFQGREYEPRVKYIKLGSAEEGGVSKDQERNWDEKLLRKCGRVIKEAGEKTYFYDHFVGKVCTTRNDFDLMCKEEIWLCFGMWW